MCKYQFYSFCGPECNKLDTEHQRIMLGQSHQISLNTVFLTRHHILSKRTSPTYQGDKLIIVKYTATILTSYSPAIQYLKIISYLTENTQCFDNRYLLFNTVHGNIVSFSPF